MEERSKEQNYKRNFNNSKVREAAFETKENELKNQPTNARVSVYLCLLVHVYLKGSDGGHLPR